MTKENTKENA